jgi:predicted ATPase/DNA-binding SARP family transcriptional activator
MLGAFVVTVRGHRLAETSWHRRKARQLFKCLLTHPDRRLLKDEAVELLWPDSDPAAGATNLRSATHALRKVLGIADARSPSELVTVDRDSIRVGGQDEVWVDADAFEQAAVSALQPGTVDKLEAAGRLYAGQYLPGDVYEDWGKIRRERLELLWVELEFALARQHELNEMLEAAITELQRVITADRSNERAAQELMRLHIRVGRRADAMRIFQGLERTLRVELDVEPSQTTQELFQRARSHPMERARAEGVPRARRRALPNPLTQLVGRERELLDVRQLLESNRLVTLIGAGGIGKTRLALEIGRRLAVDEECPVAFVDFGPLGDESLVARAVAASLAVREQPATPLLDALAQAVGRDDLLLVLDNCEHVILPTADLAASLLASCSRLRILATSREPMCVSGETIVRVPPLELPARHAPVSPEGLANCEAGRLFLERAHAALPTFVLTDHNSAVVAAICRRLDGLPLALELAAARVRGVSVSLLAERLDDRFRLLVGGAREAPPRQRTLAATIDWSYRLLSPAEQALFRRLSVFPGGWTVAAAEVVGAGGPVPEVDVLNLLTSLVDKSLVISESEAPCGELRYRMLETIRQYALDRLLETDEAGAVRGRHRDCYVALAEGAGRELIGPKQPIWLQRLDRELDNIRAALDWSEQTQDDVDAALKLASGLQWFWSIRGYWPEARARVEQALGRSRGAITESRARGLAFLGRLESIQGNPTTAYELGAEALSVARAVGNSELICDTARSLARTSLYAGDEGQARQLATETLRLARACGSPAQEANAYFTLGWLDSNEGQLDTARAYFESALACGRRACHVVVVSQGLLHLALVALAANDANTALTLASEAGSTAEAAGYMDGIDMAGLVLGDVARVQGNLELARTRYLARQPGGIRAWRLPHGPYDRWAGVLAERWAGIEAEAGREERAAYLVGATDRWIAEHGMTLPKLFQAPWFSEPSATRNRAHSEPPLAAAYARGQAAGLEQVLSELLADR